MAIDTSREAVERLRRQLASKPDATRFDLTRKTVEALLAERDWAVQQVDAALADVARLTGEVEGWAANAVHERGRATELEFEVARLSTPPDDAEVEAAHLEWFATTYPHTYADVQSDYEALDAFVTSEEAWAAATRATLAKHGSKT